jgi:hypothetical protein
MQELQVDIFGLAKSPPLSSLFFRFWGLQRRLERKAVMFKEEVNH